MVVRRWPIALIGAIALALPALGLVEVAGRAGPIDTVMEPVVVAGQGEGAFTTRGDSSVAGVCLMPPCDAMTSIDLRIDGLPMVPYTARLVGAASVDLGHLQNRGSTLILDWEDDADHSDKDRLELLLADRPIHAWSLTGTEVDLDGPLRAVWPVASVAVHLSEIGMVAISTVATATLSEPPPTGWRYHAALEGTDGRIDLGALEGDGTVLDGRVERVPLEEQERIVVLLVPEGGAWDGFPALAADLRSA